MMGRTSTTFRGLALLLVMATLSAACGQTVLVREFEATGGSSATQVPGEEGASTAEEISIDDGSEQDDLGLTVTSETDAQGVQQGTAGTRRPPRTDQRSPVAAEDRCADGATDTGVYEDRIVWGSILPLSGPTRPLGEQTARVMQRAVSYYNTLDHDPSRPDLNWRCPDRPGIYGRQVDLKIAAISSDSEDDALQAMRRLVDVEKAFLVRDCYLQSSLMGPAHAYAERNGVITFWCYPESLPQPELMPWTWALGTGRQMQVALHVGYLVNELGRKRIGMLYDPTYEEQAAVVRNVAERLGAEVVAEVQARAQTAVNGRRSEVIALRNANPDAVIVLDALNATYAGVAAGQLQWRPADSGVAWACNNCWLKFQADVCGRSCEEMITNTSGVPFVPNSPGAEQLWDSKQQIFPNEPNDILTFAAILITAGLFVYTAEAGPDLTREKLVDVFLSLDEYSGAGLPPITTSPTNHFGASADWLVQFSGDSWPRSFEDLTGGYVGLSQVGVRAEWTDPT